MKGVHKPKMANKGTVIWVDGSFLAFNVDFNNFKPQYHHSGFWMSHFIASSSRQQNAFLTF